MKRRFELRHLEAFVAVARESNFTRAADGLHLSQPALSRCIQQLESAVDTPLFDRHSRKVQLVPAAQLLLVEAQKVIASVAALERKMRLAVEGRAGRLVIGYIDFALEGILPEALQRYRQINPDADIELVRMATDKQQDCLLSGEIDVGFLLGRYRVQSVASRIVERQHYVALVPARHEFAKHRSLDIETVLRAPLVLGSHQDWSAFRRNILQEAAMRNIDPLIIQETSTSEGIFALVAAGIGISIYARGKHSIVRSGVSVRRLRGISSDIDLHMAWNTSRLTGLGKRFLKEVPD